MYDYIEQKQHDQKQEEYLNRIQYLINCINKSRYTQGIEVKNKSDIDLEILELSNKLNDKQYEIFLGMID